MADNLSVSITADTTDLRAKLAIAQADLRAYGAEVKTTATTLRTASQDMRGGLLVQLEQSAGKFNEAKVAANGFKSALGERSGYQAASQGAEEVATAHGHMAGSAGVTREVLVMLHETMMGNYKRLAGSTVVLAERTNLLHTAISSLSGPMGAAVGAAAALAGAMVILAMRAHQAETALRGVYNAALLQGRAAAAAEGATQTLADRMTATGQVGSSGALTMAAGIERIAKISDETRTKLADLAPAMEKILGDSGDDKATESFLKLFSTTGALKAFVEENALLAGEAHQKFLVAVQGDDLAGAAALAVEGLNARVKPGWDEFVRQAQEAKHNRDIELMAGPESGGLALAFQPGSGATMPPLRMPDLGSKAPDAATQRQDKAVEEGNKSAVELAAAQAKLALSTDAWNAATQRVAASQKQVASASDDAGKSAAQAALVAAQGDQQRAAAAKTQYQEEIELAQKRADTAWEAAQTAAFDKIKQKAEDAAGSQKQAAHDTLVAEERFYTDLAKQADLSAEHRQDAEHKAHMAHLQLLAEGSKGVDTAARRDLETELGKLSAEQAANHDNFAKVIELEDQKIALLTAAGAKYSVQLQAELTKRATMEREHAAEVVRIAESQLANKRALDDQDIAQRREELELEVATHAMSKAQEIAALQAFIAQKHAIELADMNAELGRLQQGTEAYRKYYDEIAKLQAKWATENKRANLEATQDLERQWDSALAPISGAFDSSMSGVIQGTQTFQQAIARMAQSVVVSYAKMGADAAMHWAASQLRQLFTTKITEAVKTTTVATGEASRTAVTTTGAATRATVEQSAGLAGFLASIARRVAAWLGMETAQTAATTAGASARAVADTVGSAAGTAARIAVNIATVTADAAVAAAGAFAATAAIPIVGPALAPAAAAAAEASVLAFLPQASLDQGSMNLPTDMIAQVHKGEMIIPAAQASALRARMAASGAMSSGASGSFAGLAAPASPSGSIAAATSSGDNTSNVALHYNPVFHGAAPAGLASQLRSQGDDFKSYLWNMTRNGNLALRGRGL